MFRLSSIDRVQQILREDMFFYEWPRMVFRELLVLRQNGREFDSALFVRHMQQIEPRPEGHWDRDLAAMAESAIHAEHIVTYAETIRGLWIERQAITASAELIDSAYEGADFQASLASHVTTMQRLMESGESSGPVSITTNCLDLMAAWENPQEAGISTGFLQLDRLTRGLMPEGVTVVAGRPGQGKTGLALAIADSISRESAVVIFSMEMSRLEILGRLVSRLIEMPVEAIERAVKAGRPPAKLADVLQQLSQRQIVIDGRDHMTIDQIAATARIQAGKGKLGLIVIDYLQLITPRDRRVNREQQIAESSRSIKQLAKQLRCPVLLLSQMSRAVESRDGKRPQLSDLRESGAIEQDADVVMFIHEDPKVEKSQRLFLILKNRHGPLGEVTAEWLPHLTTFHPVKSEWHDPDNYEPAM